MTDIVTRLRELAPEYDTDGVMLEAADEIERLRAWNYRLLQRADAAHEAAERYRAEVDRINRATDHEIDAAIATGKRDD